MYQNTLDFLQMVLSFFETIFAFDIIAGISLGTVLLYNFCFVTIFLAFTHKG